MNHLHLSTIFDNPPLSSYHILGNAGLSLQQDFYTIEGLAEQIVGSALISLDNVPDHRLRPMLHILLSYWPIRASNHIEALDEFNQSKFSSDKIILSLLVNQVSLLQVFWMIKYNLIFPLLNIENGVKQFKSSTHCGIVMATDITCPLSIQPICAP